MTLAALLVVVGQAAAAPPELGCLPGQDGFLTMRLRGSIEEDIQWSGPALACEAMARPDGRGLRLRFAGPRAGGELAVVFAVPQLGIGAPGRNLPVNVTLLDGAAERIYGTRGDSHCVLDEVVQQSIEDETLPPKSYLVTATGFCIAPARAVDGDGSVLPIEFRFKSIVTDRQPELATSPAADLPEHFGRLGQSEVVVRTSSGSYPFRVWIAANDLDRERGLMHVRELPAGRGMLFLFEPPRFVAFWMKNTFVPLDLVFIDAAGSVINVVADTRPHSLDPIASRGPAASVLELAAGTAARIGLRPGDTVRQMGPATPSRPESGA
jgi:hypothetical protein